MEQLADINYEEIEKNEEYEELIQEITDSSCFFPNRFTFVVFEYAFFKCFIAPSSTSFFL